MRLYSLHPKYLDKDGLNGVWRGGLLAQACLIKGEYTKCICQDKTFEFHYKNMFCNKCKGTGKIKTPYYNHSQLERFKNCKEPIEAIGHYLMTIYEEALSRNYNYDLSKIHFRGGLRHDILTVTKKQLEYEWYHLYKKLLKRARGKAEDIWYWTHGLDNILNVDRIQANPLFKVIEGDIESWEKIK